jgi:hypothetical protein
MGNGGMVEALPEPYHGRPYRLYVTLPPLGAVFFVNEAPKRVESAESSELASQEDASVPASLQQRNQEQQRASDGQPAPTAQPTLSNSTTKKA